MLHPDIIIKRGTISGKGLFAKKMIPKGTVVYVVRNDIRVYSKKQFNKFSDRYKRILEKFANEDTDGRIIHHIDGAKYGNHSCHPNCNALSTWEAGVDIALRNIEKDEELTWDYGTIVLHWRKPIKCNCNSKNCRKKIFRVSENSRIIKNLKLHTKQAQKYCLKVKQPLLNKKERFQLAMVLRSPDKAQKISS